MLMLSDKVNYGKQKGQGTAQAGLSGDGGGFRRPRRRLSLQIPGQPGQGFGGGIEWSRDGDVEPLPSITPSQMGQVGMRRRPLILLSLPLPTEASVAA
jgi:hypothetical protein